MDLKIFSKKWWVQFSTCVQLAELCLANVLEKQRVGARTARASAEARVANCT